MEWWYNLWGVPRGGGFGSQCYLCEEDFKKKVEEKEKIVRPVRNKKPGKTNRGTTGR